MASTDIDSSDLRLSGQRDSGNMGAHLGRGSEVPHKLKVDSMSIAVTGV